MCLLASGTVVLLFSYLLWPSQLFRAGPVLVQAWNLHLNITEEISVGTSLGSLLQQLAPSASSSASTSAAQAQAQTGVNVRPRHNNLSLVFLEGLELFAAHFELNESTLEVRTRARIDREMLCGPGVDYRLPEHLIQTLIASDEQRGSVSNPGAASVGRTPSRYAGRKTRSGECVLEFQLVLRPSMAPATLTIVVNDVNDWAPTFRPFLAAGSEVLVRNLRENNEPNVCVELPPPIDLDAGPNVVREMRLMKNADSARFGIRWKQPPTKFGDLCLYPIVSLDREVQDSYRLQIEALDSGSQQLSGVLNLTVVLTDANDNSPVFERERYTLSIAENTPPETLLVRVNASDADFGENARLLYSLASDDSFATQHLGVGQEIDPPFRIDRDTGVQPPLGHLLSFADNGQP